jgi:hypothetical protein
MVAQQTTSATRKDNGRDINVVYRREHFGVELRLRVRDLFLIAAALTTVVSSCGTTFRDPSANPTTQQGRAPAGTEIRLVVPLAHVVIDIVEGAS